MTRGAAFLWLLIFNVIVWTVIVVEVHNALS